MGVVTPPDDDRADPDNTTIRYGDGIRTGRPAKLKGGTVHFSHWPLPLLCVTVANRNRQHFSVCVSLSLSLSLPLFHHMSEAKGKGVGHFSFSLLCIAACAQVCVPEVENTDCISSRDAIGIC